MGRWRNFAEIWLASSVWPIGAMLASYAGFKTLIWSYGGRDEFRRQIMTEPQEKEWFMVNPRKVFFRDAPLSNVPTRIPADIGTPAAALLVGGEHPHAKNY